jgi:two-component system, chemotaxis family, protein-glutamate methylesterase/glutaminase
VSSDRRTVLVVDDSPFVRRVIVDLIARDPGFVVVGEAGDGHEAIAQVHTLHPDLVTLDVEMPGLDGLQTLGYIMSEIPRPVVMLSALDSVGGADLTLRALELGAVDFVRKPSRADALDEVTLGDRLLQALRAAVGGNFRGAPVLARPRVSAEHAVITDHDAQFAVVIAASTGGPRALAEIVPALPSGLAVAVLIAQHMPAGFTESLARRLDALSALRVVEARDGVRVRAGWGYVAPGGRHTRVTRDAAGVARLEVRDGPAIHGVRPAADPLLASAAECFGGRCVGVVLTGMGRDGADGLAAVRLAGGFAIVQDRETSIVHGMPAAALAQAGADRVAPLEGVAATIGEGLARVGCTGAHLPPGAPT